MVSFASDVATLREALQRAHDGPYTVEWSRRLSAALDRLRQYDVDIVLINLMLPDSHGIDTFARVFIAAPHVPILTLSTVEDEVSESRRCSAVPKVKRVSSRDGWLPLDLMWSPMARIQCAERKRR